MGLSIFAGIFCKELAYFVNTFSVYPDIPVTSPRPGSNVDELLFRYHSQFHVIDKVKDRRGKGGPEV